MANRYEKYHTTLIKNDSNETVRATLSERKHEISETNLNVNSNGGGGVGLTTHREDSTRSAVIEPGQSVAFDRPNVTEYLTITNEKNDKTLCSNQPVKSNELFEINQNQQPIKHPEAQVGKSFSNMSEVIKHSQKIEEDNQNNSACSLM